MVDYDKLKKSLKQLQLQFANHRVAQNRAELTHIDREAIKESVIQRFETCYDTLWKTLKHHLIEEFGLPKVPSSPKPILKLAGQNALLPSPVEQWLRYADARTNTTHDYSEDKATAILSIMGRFLDDAIALTQTMTGTSECVEISLTTPLFFPIYCCRA